MKNLLHFKYIDLAAQLLALLVPLAWAFISRDGIYYLGCYVSLGTVQILSCFLNSAFLPKILRHKHRMTYIKTLVGIFIFTVATAVVLLYIIGFVLMLVLPFIAAWYISITHSEMKLIQRALVEGIEFKQTQQ